MSDSHYIHGTDPAEQQRLSKLNDLLNHLSLREMDPEVGDCVLDVGCGLGQLTRAIADRVGPTGRVIGIERSPEQLASAERLARVAGGTVGVEFRQGTAENPPLSPDELGRFDIAHTRFVLEHVRDPGAVVRAMVAAVRPGGRIILEDDGHDIWRMSPEPPGFAKLWNSYVRTYDRAGNDPYVGHRLVSLLAAAGAEPVRNTWLFLGACAGQRALLKDLVENLIGICEGVRGPILEMGELDEHAFTTAVSACRTWTDRPDAALWYGVSWAEGRKAAL